MCWRNIAITILLITSFVCGQSVSSRRKLKRGKPNLVIILTDDQDVMLNSMRYMPKTTSILKDGGATFTNAFTNSPICCPSRSSFLTGVHVHNHNVWTNNDNCSSLYWKENFETKTFASYLHDSGYLTGYFGKYLNEYDGTYIPHGWKEWIGQLKNTAFYNYTINHNGRLIFHGNDYYKDYFTDLIANDSVTFLKNSKLLYPSKPIAMVLSMPAPHGPEDSAPQYSRMFSNITDHRTPNWNYAPNPDKDHLLTLTGKMEPIQAQFTDMLMRKRIMTLQSVDDAVEKVYQELKDLGELDNTYIIYTSDHGYHLGQFGIPKGKSMPYDFDTRIPMFIRGPGVKPGSIISNLVGLIDIAPTLLELAEVPVPEDMDGKSLKSLIDSYDDGVIRKKSWRDTYLIERGKMRKQLVDEEFDDMTENFLTIYFTKNDKVENKCEKPKYQYPCRIKQKFYCHKDSMGRKRIRKCSKLTRSCPCDDQIRLRKRRFRRKADGSYVQRCSVVNGDVVCSRLDSDEQSWNDQRHALDSLITQYREQLSKLKDLRKDMRSNIGRLDYDKYKLSSVAPFPAFPDTLTNVTISQKDVTEQLPKMRQNVNGDGVEEMCLCSDENDLRDSEFMPEDIDIEEVAEEIELSETSPGYDEQDGLDGLSRRERKKQERKLKRDERRRARRLHKSSVDSKRNNPYCHVDGLECTVMDNKHWRTEPTWTLGPFCYCNNAQSNVFWCIRTINETQNFLYCEYINGFLSYFDMNKDPWQLRNAVHDLSYSQLNQLHELLAKQKRCKGSKECTYRYREKFNMEPMIGKL